jgi:hypothetical protein
MFSTSSMIVELVIFHKFRDRNPKKIDVPKNALSCTGYEREITSQQSGTVKDPDTHVFHESINVNLDQTTSIRRNYCLQQTTSTFPCDVIPGHYCDFSTDLEGQATLGRLATLSHLKRSLSVTAL